ncbi:hypothetical protein BHE74_00012195 [Ensete ventricosum]|nr:hypothetical protein GW17_00033602 [Ensete ventricosum]RWW79516.1 hypothetical protein BHE74_00012195 [Ensete ventricosum]RZS01654.1 hypothetical protein BHM03_00031557 [Ensete ventricosum]
MRYHQLGLFLPRYHPKSIGKDRFRPLPLLSGDNDLFRLSVANFRRYQPREKEEEGEEKGELRNRWGLGISGLEWLGRARKQGSPAASTELKLSRGKEMEEINKGFGVSHLVADDADGGRGRAITPKPAIRIHLTPKSWALRHYARDSCLIPSDDGEISGPTIRRLGVAKRVAVSHGIKWTVES